MINTPPLPSGVSVVPRNPEKIAKLWLRLRGYDRLFSDSTLGDVRNFEGQMGDPRTVLFELHGGVVIATEMRPGDRCSAHVAFWDHKLSARVELIQEILIWAFLVYDLQRVEAIIPSYARALRNFMTKRLGFKIEGKLRDRISKGDRRFDQWFLGLLRREVLDGVGTTVHVGRVA
tara:strand:+ start:167 stop:691 length:525 start_codon:yes stop_codon:yes gene_type:complete